MQRKTREIIDALQDVKVHREQDLTAINEAILYLEDLDGRILGAHESASGEADA
jgi:hypothetical protein